uniref:Ig-like domain-containing protein n=1 Tax=Mastacembelus armatus TaxID=205130 RepID=A0A3Q3RUT2_9TELE
MFLLSLLVLFVIKDIKGVVAGSQQLAALYVRDQRECAPEGDETATEGDTVTLRCLYNSSSSSGQTLYWYKQDGNNSPTFILSRVNLDEGNTPDEYRERFSSTLNSTSRSVPLKIQKLQLSDSAVYYCALQPTVTGNTKTLYKNL